MQKITPFLWFDGNAEEAANFYALNFKNSRMVRNGPYGESGSGPKCPPPNLETVLPFKFSEPLSY